jgi:hypothetical protein
VVSTIVGGGLVYGSQPIARPIVRPVGGSPPMRYVPPAQIGPSQPFTPTDGNGSGIQPWGGSPPATQWGGNPSTYGWPQYGGSSQYQGANNPTSQNNLAQLTLLYQSNPASLTSQQWSQLQAAGVISGSTPYSDASLVNPQSSAATLLEQEEAAAAADTTTATTATTTSSILGVDPANGATTIFGLDWYYVAGFGLIAAWLLTKKH